MLTMNKATVIAETKDRIEIEAPAKTDFFVNPGDGTVKDDAPFYYEKRKGDFVASVKVRPCFKKRYDAGGLFVYDGAKKWIKLEFEMTDLGYPSVVSVVTDGSSDDCNGERMDDREEIRLQIARRGDTWALHFSEDGKKWKMARIFRFKMKDEVRVGIEAQSPVGSGCSVEFEKYRIVDFALKDMRKGR
jgi:uncharacterized protein